MTKATMLTDESSAATAHQRRVVKAVVAYFGITCLLTWLVWVPMALSRHQLISVKIPMTLYFAGAFGPFLGAMATSTWFGISSPREVLVQAIRWKGAGKWISVAILLPGMAYGFAAVATYVGLADRSSVAVNSFSSVTLIFLTFLLITPGEELGWRGFALPTLETTFSTTTATIVVWLMWGIWHLPAFFVGLELESMLQWATLVVGFFFLLLPVSFLFTWAYNKSNGKTLVPIVMHASVAATSSTTNVAMLEPLWFFTSLTIAYFLILALVFALGLWK